MLWEEIDFGKRRIRPYAKSVNAGYGQGGASTGSGTVLSGCTLHNTQGHSLFQARHGTYNTSPTR